MPSVNRVIAVGQATSPPQYFLSPQTLRMTGCRCIETRDPPQTAIATIDYMLRRLDKLWSRMRSSRLDTKVKNAAERVLLSLRSEGLELFHLVGWNMGQHQQGSKHRIQLSIMLLIPGSARESWLHHQTASQSATSVSASSEGIGSGQEGEELEPDHYHQIVAELSVFILTNGRRKGQVERVDTRLWRDWADATSLSDYTYYRADDAPPPLPVQAPAEGEDVSMTIWTQVSAVMDGAWQGLRAELDKRLGRAMMELESDGAKISGFEVEKLFKKTEGEQFIPTARLAIAIFDEVSKGLENGPAEGREKDGVEDQEGWTSLDYQDEQKIEQDRTTTNGAVILVEGRAGDVSKIKHIIVIYEGEAPVVHRYRNKVEPPRLPGLEDLITV